MRLRRQLPSNIFVQFLAGPRGVRTGVVGFMLRLIAWITLVIAPLALLVFFQLQFLPYHHEPITWWHRLAVLADLALLWKLWPSVARGEMTWITWRDLRHGKVAAAALVSLAPLLLVFTIATFPGEWLDKLPSVRFVPMAWIQAGRPILWRPERTPGTWVAVSLKPEKVSLHEVLVAGLIDLVARKQTSVWSNRLVLPGIDVIDRTKFDSEAKIAAACETLSLRGRRLEGAILIGARLTNVDFAGVHLQGAVLDAADLRGANFNCAEVWSGRVYHTFRVGERSRRRRPFQL